MSEFSKLNGYDVKDKKAIRYYDTVALMKSDLTLKEGMFVKTKGYYQINDGGSAEYYITDNENLTQHQETLDNGLYATLVINNLVNVKQFGAKGDGISDDTDAFNNAIASIENEGVIFIPDGHYLINQIIIPKNVTLKSNHQIIPYNVTHWYDPSTQDVDNIPCLLKKNTNEDNMIICYGFLENICIDGNNKQGNAVLMLGGFYGLFVTRAEKGVRLYTDGYGDGTYISNSNNYDLEHLYIMGNFGDGLVITGADARIQHFNIASNKGHGILITQTGGTLYFNEGKIEWNGKNNLYTNTYCKEIVFNNCIIDGANWYNFYNQSGGEFTFENCMIKGGRRDDTYNGSVEISPNTTLSQIYIGYSTTFMTFNGCYFRKENQWEGTEQIEYIIGSDTLLNSLGYLNFTACNMPNFDIAHILYNIPTYNYYFVGCNYLGTPLIGSPAKGLMPVLPFTDTTNSTSQRYPIDGALGYDYNKNFAVLNVYGNIRKIPTYSDYFNTIVADISLTGTNVLNEITMPSDKGTYLITCSVGGSSNTNYYYTGIFYKIYGNGSLTDLSKSNEMSATLTDGILKINCTQTIYDGRLSIIKI